MRKKIPEFMPEAAILIIPAIEGTIEKHEGTRYTGKAKSGADVIVDIAGDKIWAKVGPALIINMDGEFTERGERAFMQFSEQNRTAVEFYTYDDNTFVLLYYMLK